MIRRLRFAASLAFAVASFASPRIADAHGTRAIGVIPVSAQVAGTCLIDPSSTEAPVVCGKGTNVIIQSSLMTLADVGALLAANGANPIGLGSAHTSWKLVTVSL